MTASPYASDAKIAEALAVIEAEHVGTREQTILQQIFVACATSGSSPSSPTLYYLDQGSGLWGDADNWFEDQGGTIPHGAVPTESDNCEINAGNIVDEVPSSGYVNVVNNGTVTANNGTVTTNNGTVTSNYGTVNASNTIFANYGTVNINNGTITANPSTVFVNYGMITDNTGTVTQNCGTIVNNYGYAGPCE